MVAANKAKEILITVVSLLSSLQTPIDKEHTTPNGVVEVDAIVEGQIKSLHEQDSNHASGKMPKAQIII